MTNAEQKYSLIVCLFSNNYIAIALYKAVYSKIPSDSSLQDTVQGTFVGQYLQHLKM